MTIFTDIEAALEEADFLATRLRQRTYILDAGNMRNSSRPEFDTMDTTSRRADGK
jgi:hypothetical protein